MENKWQTENGKRKTAFIRHKLSQQRNLLMGLVKTKGILFHKTRFSESSLVIKVFTEELGLRTYMVRRSKKKGGSLFQHLALLDLEVYEREGKDINYIKEIAPAYSYNSLPYDLRKSTVLVFLNEVIYKSIREESQNKEMFKFLFEFLCDYDKLEENVQNQHLYFLVNFTRYLGSFPGGKFTIDTPCFNIEEGLYQTKSLPSRILMDTDSSKLLYTISSAAGHPHIETGNKQRRVLIEYLLDYYRYHLSGFGEMKSLKILQDVFD